MLFLIGAAGPCFLFVYEMSRETLNGFAPNSHGRRVWSLAQTNLKVKDKDQRSKTPGTKKLYFSALSAACVRFVFGKTSLTSIVNRLIATYSKSYEAKRRNCATTSVC